MKLGIIAGGGDLPRQLMVHAETQRIPYHVFPIRGQAEVPDYEMQPHTLVGLGTAGHTLRSLKQNNITDVVMIGRVRRPGLRELRPDWQMIKLLPRLGLASLGDDGLLRNVIKVFEEHGLKVRAIHDFLPQLLAPLGVWTRQQPDAALQADIERGIEAAKMLGQADVGQAVVVQDGLVIAAEAVEGTDAMLSRAAANKRTGGPGVLVKLCKPQQDKRIDMPTIGVRTVEQAAAAGLAGIVVSAGRTLVDDYEATKAAADAKGLFVMGAEA